MLYCEVKIDPHTYTDIKHFFIPPPQLVLASQWHKVIIRYPIKCPLAHQLTVLYHKGWKLGYLSVYRPLVCSKTGDPME